MILRHTTLTVNLPSIRKRGLDPRFSGGRTVGIWLHEPHRTEWAEGHIRNRDKLYGCQLSLTTLEVNVPRSWLRRSKHRAWICDQVIPPDRIIREITHEAMETEEINRHKLRFQNCLLSLSDNERKRWMAELVNAIN